MLEIEPTLSNSLKCCLRVFSLAPHGFGCLFKNCVIVSQNAIISISDQVLIFSPNKLITKVVSSL